MVALEPDLHQDADAPDDSDSEITLVEEAQGPFAPCTHLSRDDRALLENVGGHLPLLADLTHADAVLFARADDQVVVVAEAQPVPVASPEALPMAIGRTMAREESPLVFRVLFDGRTRNQVTTTVIRGAPVLQEGFAIRNERGRAGPEEVLRYPQRAWRDGGRPAQRDAADRARTPAQTRRALSARNRPGTR